MVASIGGLILVIVFTACSTMPKDFEPPKISIANIVPKDMTLMEQRFDVQLRIQNPNNFDLGINGARFDIDLNGKEFGNGMSGAKVTVPRFGSELISGEVITGLGGILRQAQGLSSGLTKVQYRLKGKAFADSPGTFTIPFEDTGDIDLNFGSSGEK
jgi:LEA14-like dessication related protein